MGMVDIVVLIVNCLRMCVLMYRIVVCFGVMLLSGIFGVMWMFWFVSLVVVVMGLVWVWICMWQLKDELMGVVFVQLKCFFVILVIVSVFFGLIMMVFEMGCILRMKCGLLFVVGMFSLRLWCCLMVKVCVFLCELMILFEWFMMLFVVVLIFLVSQFWVLLFGMKQMLWLLGF